MSAELARIAQQLQDIAYCLKSTNAIRSSQILDLSRKLAQLARTTLDSPDK